MRTHTGRGLANRIRFWTTFVVGVSSLLMVGLAGWISQSNHNVGSAIEAQYRQQDDVQELDLLSHTIVSSYRAFVAYGRPEFLDGFFENINKLQNGLTEVRTDMEEGTAADKRNAEEVAYIQSMWIDLRANMEKGIELKKSGDVASVDQLSQSRVSPTINSVNLRFQGLLDNQQAHFQSLIRENKEKSFQLLLIPSIIILLTGFTGYYLVYYIRRTVVSPVLRMSAAVSRIADGDFTESLETSERPDEIGDLQRGIHAMAADLRSRESELERSNRELIQQRDLLEAQNEEIFAQQEEQRETLEKLTHRERELEMISTYQEKLTGYLELEDFLGAAVPLLLRVAGADGAAVVLAAGQGEAAGDVVYTVGVPSERFLKGRVALYGPAERILQEGHPIPKLRVLCGEERDGLPLYDRALDLYVPLVNTEQTVYGFLLLTLYGGTELSEESLVPNKGVLTQFGLSLQAQLLSEERRKQAGQLLALNEELFREKLALQEQRDLIRQVNESIHEGMLMLDSDRRIRFANRRMEEYFGFVYREGQTLDDFCLRLADSGFGDSSFIQMKVAAMLEGGDRAVERFMVDSPDGIRHYELYINSLEGGFMEEKGILLVFRDRTEEEKVDEMKNEFVSIVSHELRTPLSSVLGFIEILLYRKVSEEKMRRYLETIHGEANRLSNLINDFLDLQRMESGRQIYQPVPTDLPELVRHVGEQWQGKNGHRIRLEFEEERMFAVADTDRIMQVMHNLISNAVKYSPGSELVDIRLKREEDFIRIDVQDYGLGIPEDAKARLFTKFYRVDNSDRRQIGGTGLGLAIVKEIVEAHGGRLGFESELGKGSVFTVHLPVYREKELSGKVVILEDDGNLATMISASFEKMNVPTVWIASAEDALYSLDRSGGNILLCIVDIQLQGVRSGWDFVSELLKHPVHRDTPVIISTVLEQPNHFFETPKGRFLRKPFTVSRLQELAQQLITERHTAASVVFPVQDEETIAESLQHQGLTVRQIKVNKDVIEVDLEKESPDA